MAIFAGTYTGFSLDATKAYLPDLQFLNVPGTGHFLMMEKPAEFNRQIVAFVDRQVELPGAATAIAGSR